MFCGFPLVGTMGANLGAYSVRNINVKNIPTARTTDKGKPPKQTIYEDSEHTSESSDKKVMFSAEMGQVHTYHQTADFRETQTLDEKRRHRARGASSGRHHKRKRVAINVSGFRYETYEDTLEKFPETLLGDPEKRSQYYDKDYDELFFDRNKQVFELILYFYQSSGRLVCPPEVSPEILIEEVEFFELGENAVKAVKEILNDEDDTEEQIQLPENEFQKKVWCLFEYPDSSRPARFLAIWSVFVIVASIIILCLETLQEFKVIKDEKLTNSSDPVVRQQAASHNETANAAKSWFAALEMAFIIWFTFEYVVRLLFSPKKLAFIRSFLNIVDVLAILPYFIDLALKNSENFNLAVLRILRLIRVFRIFKLSRHSSGLQILGLTLRKSMRELGLLIFFLIIGIVIFSSMVYYAEGGTKGSMFPSIPHAFWWALVTMTTVGYGDLYPETLWGKLVGSGCALCGVLAIALPVPVIVSNFDSIYRKYRNRKLKQQASENMSAMRKSSLMVSMTSSASTSSDSEPSPTLRRSSRDPAWVADTDEKSVLSKKIRASNEAIHASNEKIRVNNGKLRASNEKLNGDIVQRDGNENHKMRDLDQDSDAHELTPLVSDQKPAAPNNQVPRKEKQTMDIELGTECIELDCRNTGETPFPPDNVKSTKV